MLKPSVKHYKGPKMLVYLQANKFHGCSRETRDSWIRDKEQFSTPRRATARMSALASLSPDAHRATQRGHVTPAQAVGCITEEEP